jgi:hypothetical protein
MKILPKKKFKIKLKKTNKQTNQPTNQPNDDVDKSPLLFFSHVQLRCHTMMRIVQQALIPISHSFLPKGKWEEGEGGGRGRGAGTSN